MYENVIEKMLPVIGPGGITAPDFQSILAQWQSLFRDIYGSDIYIEPDSKDGVLLSLIAYAMHGCNNATISVWNSFSPTTGMGEGLSRNVKINGISRKEASYSTVDLALTGRIGTVIHGGQVRDSVGNIWLLPESVTLDLHGEATVTATCQIPGAIAALPGDITEIATPTQGWHRVTNVMAASEGRPVESDSELRQRQALSVALPSRSVMEGLHGALASLVGVSRIKALDNDTDETDDNGIPPHSIAVVIDGGDSAEIANAIALKKAPGVPTWGTTEESVTDIWGNVRTIHFFRPTRIPVFAEIKVKPLTGYTTEIGDGIANAVVRDINALSIGETLYYSRLFKPASLSRAEGGDTYEILGLEVGLSADALSAENIAIAFNEMAVSSAANIKITTVSV
jgi:uncharacterized phage protein gp47/JayE